MSATAQKVISQFKTLSVNEKRKVVVCAQRWEDEQDVRLIRDTLATSNNSDFIPWETMKRDLDDGIK